MRLLEIVRGHATAPEVIATSLRLAKRLGKIGVPVGNCFGFVANRMLAYYMREALLLLEEGAPASQIDSAMARFGLPVGPFAMQDIAGIDVGWRIRQFLKRAGQDARRGAAVRGAGLAVRDGPLRPEDRRRMVPLRGGQPHARSRSADRRTGRQGRRRNAGSTRRAVSDDEIIARVMTALANEGARVLEDGYGSSRRRHRHHLGQRLRLPAPPRRPHGVGRRDGPGGVLANVREYRQRLGEWWQPAPLMERLAASGGSFYASVRKTAT